MPSGASRTQLVIVAAIIALSAVIAQTHVLHRLTHHDGAAAATATPTTTAHAGATTTTLEPLVVRDYQVGDCVTWDQDSAEGATSPDVVNCAKPHLVQMTGRAPIKDSSSFPGKAYFEKIDATTCVTKARAVLGHDLDLHGRYAPFVVYPQEVSWQIGKHVVWCGLMSGLSPEGRFAPMTGSARGADQALDLPAGTCLVKYPKPSKVSCTARHDIQVVGSLDLRGRYDSVPTARQWSELAHTDCTPAARKFLGHDPTPPTKVGVLPLSSQSWAVGTRSTECILTSS